MGRKEGRLHRNWKWTNQINCMPEWNALIKSNNRRSHVDIKWKTIVLILGGNESAKSKWVYCKFNSIFSREEDRLYVTRCTPRWLYVISKMATGFFAYWSEKRFWINLCRCCKTYSSQYEEWKLEYYKCVRNKWSGDASRFTPKGFKASLKI